MNCRLPILFTLAFSLHASVYSIHNFMFPLLRQTGVVNNKNYCLFQFLHLFKSVSVLVSSNISDRKGIHRYLIDGNILLYSLTILAMYNLRLIRDIFLRKKYSDFYSYIKFYFSWWNFYSVRFTDIIF